MGICKDAEERWGSGVVEQVSLDLRREFPQSNIFSARNLWYMKQWYLFYTKNLEKLKQLVSEILPPKEYERQLQQNDNEGAEKMKQSEDNPTIGLLICSNMNRANVQWSFKGNTTPIGVATYNNIRIKDMLPTKEQLKEQMEILQKEMRKTKMLMNKNN